MAIPTSPTHFPSHKRTAVRLSPQSNIPSTMKPPSTPRRPRKTRKLQATIRPRVLFPDAVSPPRSPSRLPATATEDIKALYKKENRALVEAFRERWGFDVVNDCPVDDGAWKWERLDVKTTPHYLLPKGVVTR